MPACLHSTAWRPSLESLFWTIQKITSHLFTRRYEGTGIGLSITKDFVDLHKGELIIESEFGVGTITIIRLPMQINHVQDALLILDGGTSIAENLAYQVGFNILSYLTKCFNEKYVLTPLRWPNIRLCRQSTNDAYVVVSSENISRPGTSAITLVFH